MTGLTLGMVAGEASGDLLTGAVLRGLRARVPDLEAAGIGGPSMQAEGFDAWWTIDALSVRGYVEVLREYPRLLHMRSTLRKRMERWNPSLFVGIDAPDFNLDLEYALRRKGIKVAHFISPSIWAWRKERIDKIRRSVDHMLLVFPFEKALYDEAGIASTYVGHPLADTIAPGADQAAARSALGLPVDRPVIGLLPGSRGAEIRYMASLFVDTAAWIAQRRPDACFVLPAAGALLYDRLRAMLAAHSSAGKIELLLVQGRSHDVLAASDTVLVASGTATLETALFGKPMVIAYRMPWLSHRIMRRMGYLPWIGLPNILCREFVVPEFVQDDATPEAMGAALLRQIDDRAHSERIRTRFADLHGLLRRDCASRAAETLLALAAR